MRRPGAADVDVVLRLHQDPLAVAHNPGDALADRPAAQRLLQRWSDHWVRHGVGYWAVSWRDDPEVLGFCGVKVMMLHARPVSNLFHRLDPRAWGQGVGSDGPDWIFASPGWTTT